MGAKRANTAAEIAVYDLVRQGMFEIDSDGLIWRIATFRSNRYNTKRDLYPHPRRRAEHSARSYLQVRVLVDGKRAHVMAHRLVYMHFHGGAPLPAEMEVNHEDGIKAHNHPANLTLMTSSENKKHAHRIGLIDQRGERNPYAKLSNLDIAAIRREYAAGGITQERLAQKYGVTFQHISRVVRGDSRDSDAGPRADYTSRRNHGCNVRNQSNGRFESSRLQVREYPL